MQWQAIKTRCPCGKVWRLRYLAAESDATWRTLRHFAFHTNRAAYRELQDGRQFRERINWLEEISQFSEGRSRSAHSQRSDRPNRFTYLARSRLPLYGSSHAHTFSW